MTNKRKRRTFSKEFKEQIVLLHASGKPRNEIIKEYELTPSAFDKWIQQHKTSGSFEEKDNRTPEQEEMIELRKRNKQLKMDLANQLNIDESMIRYWVLLFRYHGTKAFDFPLYKLPCRLPDPDRKWKRRITFYLSQAQGTLWISPYYRVLKEV